MLGGALLFSLTMSLTSCDPYLDDIFGEWSRPTPGGDGGSSATVTSLTLGKSLRFDKNDLTAQTLTATVTPSNATIIWSSDKESVATVDATGKVTPVAPGEATITAKAGDKTATRTVYVYDRIVDISTDISVDAGESWLINGTGTTEANSITIAEGSKVTLNGINITKSINCTDNATIILADGSTNTVTVSTDNQAGIIVGGSGKTLTIDAETAGTGTLTVQGGAGGAGIGTNKNSGGGNITINGGMVTATGGDSGAGIGTGYSEFGGDIVCGDITINGGTIKATGGDNAAGIGTGYSIKSTTSADTYNRCGNITIGADVTSVTATKGTGSPYSIGVGAASGGAYQICYTISIADPSKVTQN